MFASTTKNSCFPIVFIHYVTSHSRREIIVINNASTDGTGQRRFSITPESFGDYMAERRRASVLSDNIAWCSRTSGRCVEAANRDDLFSVTSLKHYPYVANSDFHKAKHLYSWKTLVRSTLFRR